MQDFLDINNLPAVKSFCNMLPSRPPDGNLIEDRDILDYLKQAKVDLFTNVKELKDSVIRQAKRSNSQNNQRSIAKYVGSVEGHSGTSFNNLGQSMGVTVNIVKCNLKNEKQPRFYQGGVSPHT